MENHNKSLLQKLLKIGIAKKSVFFNTRFIILLLSFILTGTTAFGQRMNENSSEKKALPFTKDDVLEICDALRTPREAPQNRDYYDFEWRLLQLAGIKNPEDTDDEIIKEKMSTFINKYHFELECPTATRVYPKGGFYRQLIRNDTRFAVEYLLEDYDVDPNIIDSDGCTVLDYVDMMLNQYGTLKPLADQFKSYRELLIKHNAKHANELGGEC